MTTSTLDPASPAGPRQPRGPHEHAGTGSGDHAYDHAYGPRTYDHAEATHTATDHLPLLALLAPLLLFTHGIVAWVDGLDSLDDAPLRRPRWSGRTRRRP